MLHVLTKRWSEDIFKLIYAMVLLKAICWAVIVLTRLRFLPWFLHCNDFDQRKHTVDASNKNGVLRRQCGNRSEIIRKV